MVGPRLRGRFDLEDGGRQDMQGAGRATAEHEQRVRGLEQTVESLRRESEVAQALLGLSAALGTVKSVEETLALAVRIVPIVLGADRSFVGCFAGNGPAGFEVKAAHAFNTPELERLTGELRSGDGPRLLRLALEEHKTLFWPHRGIDDRLARDEVARGTAALAAIPLTRWGEDFGGLQIEFSTPRDFDAKDEAMVAGISHELAVALANARQFNLFESLHTFGLRIGRRLRLGPVLDEIARGAVDLLEARSASVYFAAPSEGTLVLAGGNALPDHLAERLARIDTATEPWRALARGESVYIPGGPDIERESSVLAAPIPVGKSPMIGAVLVMFDGNPAPGPDDSQALNVLAAQAGMAIRNARRYERQRRVARSLQTGLLRSRIPEVQGFELGRVYRSATGDSDIGGDFLDVFDLPDGGHAFSVGDVSGKGAEAAAQTAMARFMLRAFATSDPQPTSALFNLNNALVYGFAEERFTTLIYGVIDSDRRTCSLASAGHPPPLIRRASGAVEVVEVDGGLLGAFEDQEYDQTSVELGPGDMLVCYTDGLLEARAGNELYGRDRIVTSLRSLPSEGSATDAAQRIYEAAAEFGDVSDDTVVFVLTSTAEA
jgi:GAF domain-containing protein